MTSAHIETKDIPKADTETARPPNEKSKGSKSLLSVLNSLQAQFEKDNIPDLDRITRQQKGSRKEKLIDTGQTIQNTPGEALTNPKMEIKPEVNTEIKSEVKLEVKSIEVSKPEIRKSVSLRDWEKQVRTRSLARELSRTRQENKEKTGIRQEEKRVEKRAENDVSNKDNKETSNKLLNEIIVSLLRLDFLKYFNNKSMIKWFLLSSVALAIQLKVSKRVRDWFIYTVKLFIYLMSIGISASTFAIMVLKLRMHRKRLAKKPVEQSPPQTQIQMQTQVQGHNQVFGLAQLAMPINITVQPKRVDAPTTSQMLSDEQKVQKTK